MESAKFGLPGQNERILGIDATHSDMCRFNPKQSQQEKDNMEKVLDNVEELFDLALERSESMALPHVPTISLETRFEALQE